MRRAIKHLALAVIVGMPSLAAAAGTITLPATGQTTCYNSDGVILPSCTGTGQDGETLAGVAWPAPRFTDNGNGTVRDNLTGLTWSRHGNAPDRALANPCPNAEEDMSWQAALDFVACLNSSAYLGFSDWRLPNVNELESVAHAGVGDTSEFLTEVGFGLEPLDTLVQPSRYWTSTTDASFTDSAWDVDMVAGGFPLSSIKVPQIAGLDTRSVWPVRGESTGPARVGKTGQASCFDGAGASVSCNGTGQDGATSTGTAAPSPRFKTGGDGTFVLDRMTGLIWTTTAGTPAPASPAEPAGCAPAGSSLPWQEALDHISCLNRNTYLGMSQWRLPNRREMRSLVDYSAFGPALPAGNPFSDLLGDTYWTSTTDAGQPDRAWTVSMFDGSLGVSGKLNGGILSAWPVSGPDLTPPLLTMGQGSIATRLTSQTISGITEAGAAVQVAIDGGSPIAATQEGTTWNFTITGLTPGVRTVTVTATDFSENTSTSSLTITHDATAPGLSVNPVVTPTRSPSQTITGTVEAGASVTVTAGGVTSPATVNGAAWSFTLPALSPGVNDITVTATDAAENTTTQTTAITYFNTWNVTAESGPKGTVSPSGTVAVPVNGTQTFTFTPATGYQVVRVLIDGVSQGTMPSYTFTNVSGEHTIRAVFVPDGDLNNDGRTNLTDVLQVLRIAVGLDVATTANILQGDAAPVNAEGMPVPDGQLTLPDALMILRKAVGITSGW